MSYARSKVWLILALAAGVLASVGATAARAAPSARLALTISGLPAGQSFGMTFADGVDHIGSGTATAASGGIRAVIFNKNLLVLSATTETSLTATAAENVFLSGGPVTGNATIPVGAAVNASFGGGPPVPLRNGPFSLGSGSTVLGASPPTTALAVRCRGTATRCRARVPIAAGASHRRLTVRLPARGLRLRSVTDAPPVRGAYVLTGGHYSHDGRRWVATLDAPRGPAGAYLTLTFRR